MKSARSFDLEAPETVGVIGRVALGAALGLSILVSFFLVVKEPYFALAVPAAVVLVVAGVYLFSLPTANLAVVLALFAFFADHEPGIQVGEVFYGLYYFSFLAHWFLSRLLRSERILYDNADRALLLLLIGVTLSIPLSFLFQGKIEALIGEWSAMMMLGFYFPIKEACTRGRRGLVAILLVLAWLGVFVAIRNAFFYLNALENAEAAWQIVRGRAMLNDNLLMIVSLISFVFASRAHSARSRIGLSLMFLVFFAALILTQSRTYWVAFLFGAFIMFLLVEPAQRKQLILFILYGAFGFGLIALLFFGDLVGLIFAGLADRFTSVSTATVDDLSLINRFYETGAVWEYIRQNPVIGYGMGVPYRFFDLTRMSTDTDAFVHNGYVGIWYKFGLWGLGLLLYFWVTTVRQGLRAFRWAVATPLTRTAALASAVTLISYALFTIASNPFHLGDMLLTFAIVTGIGSGAYHRSISEAALVEVSRP